MTLVRVSVTNRCRMAFRRNRFISLLLFLLLAFRAAGAEWTCLTWNMCWFPSGKRDLRLPDVEPKRIAAAAAIIRQAQPHLIFLQEIRDRETCQALAQAIGGQTQAVACSAFVDRTDTVTFQQCAILMRPDPRCPDMLVLDSGFERWKRKGDIVPSRGFAYALIGTGDKNIMCCCVHLKANRSRTFKGQQQDIYNRELAIEQLLAAIRARQAKQGPRIDAVIIAGDFNTNLDDAAWVSESSLRRLSENEFAYCFQGVPAAERITIPAKDNYPSSTFDYLFYKGLRSKAPGRVVTGAPISDHNAVVVTLD